MPNCQVKSEDCGDVSEAVPGSTVVLQFENGVQKVTHPTLGLGFMNSRYMEDGPVVLDAGSAVHTVMNAATHQECAAAESMEALD